MEALSVDRVPVGKHWQYEPKWDGFRCIVFRDGKKVELQSTRYFPELVAAIGALKPKQFVLDGEIVVPAGGAFSFDALLQRIHPAASRVKRLSVETPTLLIVFDLLVDADGRLVGIGNAIHCRKFRRRVSELPLYAFCHSTSSASRQIDPVSIRWQISPTWHENPVPADMPQM